MSLKKILILPVGFILTNAIYTACVFCKCPEVTAKYYVLLNGTVKPVGSGGAVIDNGTPATVDTVLLNCSFNINCTVKSTNNFSFLVNSVYACSCAGCGDWGLKNNLSSFTITSDNIYNNIAAGKPLNNLFSVKPDYYLNSSYPFDSLVSKIKKDKYISYQYSLFTKTKPGNNSGHKFTLNLKFVDSSVIACTTANPVIWQ